MASNQPMTGRDVIPAGIDVRTIRKPINEAFASVPIELIGEGAATSTDGRRMSFTVLGEDVVYIRLDNKTTVNGTVRYGWKAVNQDRDSGNWTNSVRAGNATTDDWATELNNANLTVGTATRYPARVNPQTGRLTFFQSSGGGGNVDIRSGETVLMILGTYDEYKDCPDVPPSPPTAYTDYCNGTRGTELCVPAYAYAVYSRCGYVWNKVGDTRDFGVWANELNGGSTSAWRRFVIPRWGGDIDAATGLPDPASACMGVAFTGSGAGALTCSCPPCLNTTDGCLAVSFKTIPRPVEPPDDPPECGGLVSQLDAFNAWDKDFIIPLTPVGNWCSVTGADENGIFTFNWDFQDGASLSCDWGPDVFDPCDPCDHWGRIYAYIDVPGGNEPNCGGSGHWRGEFKANDLCNLLCDCEGSAAPIDQVFCGGCGNFVEPPAVWNAILEGSIKIICCPTELNDSANDLPATVEDDGGGLTFEDQTP